MALPFFFSGIVVSLALTRSPYSIENKSPNPLDNRADRAHRHTIIGHNMNNTGAGG
jgi:hypothetical protein